MKPRPHRLRLRRRLALLAASLLLALLLAETAVRLLNVGPQFAPVFKENFRLSDNLTLRYELVPNSHYDQITINADGMRDRDYPLEKPTGVFRIACIGDSICFGMGFKQESNYPAKLEEYLNRLYADVGATSGTAAAGWPIHLAAMGGATMKVARNDVKRQTHYTS